jgi:hypothetical protein
MGFRKVGWGGMDWIHLAQDRDPVEDSCEHGNESTSSINYWENLECLSNWSTPQEGLSSMELVG